MQNTHTPKWLDLFITAFGTQGLIALAWWSGAFHAQRIRELQTTYPILQITGGAGVGKSTLVANLWKMANTPEPDHLSYNTCSMGSLLAILARSVNRPVVIEENDRVEDSFDWELLRECYAIHPIAIKRYGQPINHLTFQGALAFVGGESEVLNRRIVNIHLARQRRTDGHGRSAVDALHELPITDMCQFVEAVRMNREQVVYRLGHVPAYAESLRTETAPGLNYCVAHNHAQLRALLDLLADLFPIPADTLHHAHTEVCGMAWVHADSKATAAPTI